MELDQIDPSTTRTSGLEDIEIHLGKKMAEQVPSQKHRAVIQLQYIQINLIYQKRLENHRHRYKNSMHMHSSPHGCVLCVLCAVSNASLGLENRSHELRLLANRSPWLRSLSGRDHSYQLH